MVCRARDRQTVRASTVFQIRAASLPTLVSQPCTLYTVTCERPTQTESQFLEEYCLPPYSRLHLVTRTRNCTARLLSPMWRECRPFRVGREDVFGSAFTLCAVRISSLPHSRPAGQSSTYGRVPIHTPISLDIQSDHSVLHNKPCPLLGSSRLYCTVRYNPPLLYLYSCCSRLYLAQASPLLVCLCPKTAARPYESTADLPLI